MEPKILKIHEDNVKTARVSLIISVVFYAVLFGVLGMLVFKSAPPVVNPNIEKYLHFREQRRRSAENIVELPNLPNSAQPQLANLTDPIPNPRLKQNSDSDALKQANTPNNKSKAL